MVTRKKLEEMFAHYIDRKRCNQAHPSDSRTDFGVQGNAMKQQNGCPCSRLICLMKRYSR